MPPLSAETAESTDGMSCHRALSIRSLRVVSQLDGVDDERRRVVLFVGDDWAEAHHDVVVLDDDGEMVVRVRFGHGLVGIGRFHELIADLGTDPCQVVIGIETDRGLWVESLIGAGYQVYAINPLAASRYRDRHTLSGAKSDAGDAKLLADLVRTDRHNHRPVAGDSDLAEGVKVLARAHQNLIRERTRHANTLRSALRDYYPGALDAFESLTHPDALAVLGRAATPTEGRHLTRSQIVAALRRGGRQRNLESRAETIQAALRAPQLEAPTVVTGAYATTTRATGILYNAPKMRTTTGLSLNGGRMKIIANRIKTKILGKARAKSVKRIRKLSMVPP